MASGKSSIYGVVHETVIWIWQDMWYGKLPFQIYNDGDRAFYQPIKKGMHFPMVLVQYCPFTTILLQV